MGDPELISTSKFLSFILRHQPQEIGLEIDRQGWASVAELIEKSRREGRDLSRNLIQKVIGESNKTRFHLSNDGRYIRAGYGHSIPVEFRLEPEVPPDTLYHGTAHKRIKIILEEGLKPGSRNYVHLTTNRSDALSVGRRHGTAVLLAVSAARMYAEGYPCYRSPSEPSIWLTERVPPQYLERRNLGVD